MPNVSIFNWKSKPDGSGDVFFEPYDVKATNDQWKHNVLIFNDTAARDGIYGSFEVPDDYGNTAQLVIRWTATATSGDVEWDFDYRAVGGDDVESLDQAGTQEAVNQNDTAPSAIQPHGREHALDLVAVAIPEPCQLGLRGSGRNPLQDLGQRHDGDRAIGRRAASRAHAAKTLITPPKS